AWAPVQTEERLDGQAEVHGALDELGGEVERHRSPLEVAQKRVQLDHVGGHLAGELARLSEAADGGEQAGELRDRVGGRVEGRVELTGHVHDLVVEHLVPERYSQGGDLGVVGIDNQAELSEAGELRRADRIGQVEAAEVLNVYGVEERRLHGRRERRRVDAG